MSFEMQRALRAPVLRVMSRSRSSNLRRKLLAGASAAMLMLPPQAHAADFSYTGGAGQASTTGTINTVDLSNVTIVNTGSQWTDNGANNELTLVMAGGLANGGGTGGTISRLLANGLTIDNTTASTNRAGIAVTIGQGHNASSQTPVGFLLTGTNSIRYSAVEATAGLGAALYATQTNTAGANSTNSAIDSSGGTAAFTGNYGIYLNQLGGSGGITTSATDTLTAITGSTGSGLRLNISNYGNAFIVNRASTTNQFGAYGIDASNPVGFLLLHNSGTLNGALGAINASTGSGVLRLGMASDLSGVTGLTGAMTGGIIATTAGGENTIMTAAGGTINTNTANGISSSVTAGAGITTITVGDTIGATLTPTSSGILASTTAGATGAVNVTANANVSGALFGIRVTNGGSGATNVTVGTGATVTGATNGIFTSGSGIATLAINGRVSGSIVTGAGNDAITLTSSATATDGVVTGAIDGGTGTNSLTLAGTSTTASQAIDNLSNIASITKSGTGTWAITGTAAINPTYTISAGTLQLGSGGTSGTLGSGAITNDASLSFNRSDNITASNTISGTGSLTKSGAGILTLSGNNSYQGGTTVAAGTLRLQHANAAGSGTITTTGSVIDYADTLTIANAININSNTTQLQVTTGTATQSGVISETGGARPLEKIGAGTLILTGANSYSGTTTISAGTLQVGAGGTAGTLGSGAVTNNGALVFNRSDASAYGGVISGTGSVTKQGAGTLTLTDVHTYTGATSLTGGTLALTGAGSIAASSGLNINSAVLNISGTTTGASLKTVTGTSGNIVLGSKTLTITDAGTNYGGVFSGAGGNLIFNGNAILSGTNSADGNATIAPGVTVTLGAGGTLGTISNTAMVNSGTLAVNHAAGASINIFTNISGTGGITLVAANAETVALTGTNSYSGLTDIQGGSLTLNNLPGVSANTTFNVGANGLLRLTSISPTLANITGSGTVLINKIGPGAAQTLSLNGANFTGTISEASAGQQLVAASGTSILAGNNNWTGSTTINAGATLQLGNGGTTGTVPTGAIINNGTLAFSRSDDVTFAGAPTGTGGISQRGTGTLFLTGTGTSAGANSVTAGILSVNGSTAGAVNVGNGATLKGAGSVGGIANASGGIVAPGNSIGTLAVNGNVSFAAGSIYQVEVDAAGASDRIAATGTATLNGGTVDVQAAAGTYGTSTTYTILTAAGGVTGQFTSATSNFIFLTPTLNYSASQVTLTLAQPVVVVPPAVVPPAPAPLTFPSVALTPNQIASSTALQAGGAAGGDVFLAVLNSTSAVTARSAFDATSGEIHATLQAAQFENAAGVRRTLVNRMRARGSDAGWSLWGTVTGNWGHMNGDGNAARATNRGVAITLGADTRINDNWRGGFSGGYAASEVGVGARRSWASLSGGQFAAYASGQYDAIAIRTGFAYGFATANSRRDVGFALFNDSLTAKQDVDSQQLFGEVGYGFALTGVTIEPFAGLSWTRVNAGSFRETGGSAALGGNGSARDDGFSTLGAQLFTGGSAFAGGILTPSVRAGWQHAFTNRLATRSLSFLSSGQNFTVFGTPLDADRATLDAEATFALGGTSISLGYTGSLGKRGEDHGIRLTASVGL